MRQLRRILAAPPRAHCSNSTADMAISPVSLQSYLVTWVPAASGRGEAAPQLVVNSIPAAARTRGDFARAEALKH